MAISSPSERMVFRQLHTAKTIKSLNKKTSEHAYTSKLHKVRPWMQAVVNECPYCLMLGCSLERFCSAPSNSDPGIAQPWFAWL